MALFRTRIRPENVFGPTDNVPAVYDFVNRPADKVFWPTDNGPVAKGLDVESI